MEPLKFGNKGDSLCCLLQVISIGAFTGHSTFCISVLIEETLIPVGCEKYKGTLKQYVSTSPVFGEIKIKYQPSEHFH